MTALSGTATAGTGDIVVATVNCVDRIVPIGAGGPAAFYSCSDGQSCKWDPVLDPLRAPNVEDCVLQ